MDDLIPTLILVGAYLAGASGVILIACRFFPAGRAFVRQMVGGQELWFAFAAALLMSLASLYLSEIRHFNPCRFCWFQRICAYPLTIVLGWAAWRRDRQAWAPALTLAGIGVALSTWHIALDIGWISEGDSCDPLNPCTTRWNGFENSWSTIQVGALCCFLFIIGLGLHALASPDSTTQPPVEA